MSASGGKPLLSAKATQGDQTSKLTKENAELKKAAKYDQEEITVLKHRCKSLDAELSKLRVNYEKLEKLQSQNTDAKVNDSLLDEIKQLRETIKHKDEQLEQYLADMDKKSPQQSKHDDLNKELSYERAERHTLERKVRALREENKELQIKLQERIDEYQIEDQSEIVNDLRAERAEIKAERDAKAREVDNLRKEIASMRSTLENLRRSSADDKRACENELSDLRSQLKTAEMELEKQRDSMRATIESLQTSGDGRRTVETELKLTTSRLKSAQIELEKERESHKEEIERLKASITQLELNLAASQSEVEKWKVDLQTITLENQDLKTQLQEKPTNFTDESSELKELRENLANEKMAHNRTKMQKEELEIRCHDAFEKINQKEKLLKNMDEQHKQLITRKDKTIGELRREKTMVNPGKDNSQELQAMRDKLELAMREMKAIKDEYDMLKKLRD